MGACGAGGALHVSLDVFNLVLGQMLDGGGTASALSHAARSALNGASALLKDVRTLAFKLEHAKSGAGQERLYLQAAVAAIRKLEPGATMLGTNSRGRDRTA